MKREIKFQNDDRYLCIYTALRKQTKKIYGTRNVFCVYIYTHTQSLFIECFEFCSDPPPKKTDFKNQTLLSFMKFLDLIAIFGSFYLFLLLLTERIIVLSCTHVQDICMHFILNKDICLQKSVLAPLGFMGKYCFL